MNVSTSSSSISLFVSGRLRAQPPDARTGGRAGFRRRAKELVGYGRIRKGLATTAKTLHVRHHVRPLWAYTSIRRGQVSLLRKYRFDCLYEGILGCLVHAASRAHVSAVPGGKCLAHSEGALHPLIAGTSEA